MARPNPQGRIPRLHDVGAAKENRTVAVEEIAAPSMAQNDNAKELILARPAQTGLSSGAAP